MTSMTQLRAAFVAGELSKPDYISAMYEQHHAQLFEYANYLPHTDIAAIEIRDSRVVMTSREHGIKIVCPPGDHRVTPVETLNFLRYEQTDSNMIMRLVEPGDTVLDIGANMGWYSLNIAKTHPSCTVHAFEPIPDTYQVLCENVSLNGVRNVHPHPYGFSSETKDLTFYFYPEGSGNASAADLSGRDDVRRITCHVEQLDHAPSLLGIGRVAFIKCDVEGAELFVFQGGRALLARDQPIVFSEMLRKWAAKFHYHPNEIIALFKALGYRCFTAESEGLREFHEMDEATLATNFFFLHGARHAAVIDRLLLA